MRNRVSCPTFISRARLSLRFIGLLITTIAGLALAFGLPSDSGRVDATTTWNVGDVFVGSSGEYKIYDNAGVFKETISLTNNRSGTGTGCSFNGARDRLYTTDYSNSRVVVFDDADPHNIVQSIDTTLHGGHGNESVVFASDGDFYVAQAWGNPQSIERYSAAGVFEQRYEAALENSGPAWIDLASDQKTMFYTSIGRRVLRYDVSGAGAQLPDFGTLPGYGVAYALRLLPPGDGSGGLLVADHYDIKRLDSTGALVQRYDVPDPYDTWFALGLDPNGTSFWAGGAASHNVYRFNIASGVVEVGPISTGVGIDGLCVKGEPTAGLLAATAPNPMACSKSSGASRAAEAAKAHANVRSAARC